MINGQEVDADSSGNFDHYWWFIFLCIYLVYDAVLANYYICYIGHNRWDVCLGKKEMADSTRWFYIGIYHPISYYHYHV